MNRITEANEGVDRRFPYKITFKKYNSIQLMNILYKSKRCKYYLYYTKLFIY